MKKLFYTLMFAIPAVFNSKKVLAQDAFGLEDVDTALGGIILGTVIYLVRKTTTLCHDVEALKKDKAWEDTKKDLKG